MVQFGVGTPPNAGFLNFVATQKDKIRAAAQKHLQKGQLDKAIREFQRLVDDDPKDVRTLLKIGDLHTRKGDYVAATQAYGGVARFYSDQGFFLKAVAVYKQILKLDPSLVDIHLKLAELYNQLGLVSDASEQYRQVCELYEAAGDDAQSIGILQKMVALDPDNVAGRIKLADMLANRGDLEAARTHYYSAAEQLRTQDRIDDFLKVADRLLHFDKDDVNLAREVAEICLDRGEGKRALAKLQVCFRMDPKDVDTLELLARAFAFVSQTQKAISVYRELMRLHRKARDRGAFMGAAESLLTLDPDDNEARVAVGKKPVESGPPKLPPGQDNVSPALPATKSSESRANASKADESKAAQAKPAEDPIAAKIRKRLIEADIYIKYGLKDRAIAHYEAMLVDYPDAQEVRERHEALVAEAKRPQGSQDDLDADEDWDLGIEPLSDSGDWDEAPRMRQGGVHALAGEDEDGSDKSDEGEDADAASIEDASSDASDADEIVCGPKGPKLDPELEALLSSAVPESDDADVLEIDDLIPDSEASQSGGDFGASDEDADLLDGDGFIALDLGEELDAYAQQADYQVSFDDVFSQFKAGVAEAVEDSDFETHYNLGIAYKEMGLLGDAIDAFRIAQSSQSKEVASLTMIGTCQLQKSDEKSALSSFLAALESPELQPTEEIALRYEIAQIYEKHPELGDALECYERAHAMDPDFRDLGERMRRLRTDVSASDDEKITYV